MAKLANNRPIIGICELMHAEGGEKRCVAMHCKLAVCALKEAHDRLRLSGRWLSCDKGRESSRQALDMT